MKLPPCLQICTISPTLFLRQHEVTCFTPSLRWLCRLRLDGEVTKPVLLPQMFTDDAVWGGAVFFTLDCFHCTTLGKFSWRGLTFDLSGLP